MTWTFERVAGPYKGITGGVTWDGNAILFSAVQEERILRFDLRTGKVDNFRKYTGRTNGIACGRDGSVYGAQEGGRRIIHFKTDGSTAPTCELLDGRHHNQPTDLVLDSRGRVWFADPHNAIAPYGPPVYPFLERGSILRLERNRSGAWQLQQITDDTSEPRALVLSADERTLFVADGNVDMGGDCDLRSYAIDDDGNVGAARILYEFDAGERGIEGLCLDSAGQIIACAGWKQNGAGPLIYVYTRDGELLESHVAPCDVPMRCAFGGSGLDRLYVTGGDGCLYRTDAGGRRGREIKR
jgi:sugar lactone lactonase YvrE